MLLEKDTEVSLDFSSPAVLSWIYLKTGLSI